SAVTVTSVAQNGIPTTGIVTDVMTFGLEGVDVFVGDGPYFQDTTGDEQIDELDEVNEDAVGLLLEDVSLALALFKPTVALGNYYAVSARAESMQLLGLNLPSSDAFSLEASGYRIEVNGGTNGIGPAAINFSALPDGKLTVQTGPGTEFDFAYTSILQKVAIENAVLTIDDFVHVSGGFAFTRQQGMSVKLSGPTPTNRVVNVLAFGASNVDIFVGSGQYFVDYILDEVIDALDERGEGTVGLALENVNFGLMVMKLSGVNVALAS